MASFLQAKAETVTTADLTVAYDSNITSGSLLVLCAREGANPPGNPTITDTLSNTWTLVQQSGRNFIYCTVSASGGANTVTYDSQGTISSRVVVFEFSGTWPANPTDALATATTPNTSPATANSVTPSAANGVAVSFLGTQNDANPFAISSGGYTLGPVASNRCAPAYLVFSSIAAYAPTYTAGAGISGTNALQNVAFIETGGSPSTPAFGRYGVRGPIR